MKTEDVKRILRKKHKREKLTNSDFLSTGSTLLNLALTSKPNCGFVKGKYHLIVGDSTSGKTFLSLTCLAEASNNPQFKKYRFIYDNAEDGALMDIEKFFGSKVAARMKPPRKLKDGTPIYSTKIEEFYYHIDDLIQKGKPFIYILDSMDSLSSKAEKKKFKQHKDAYRKNKKVPGSYGDGKAIQNSAGIRQLLTPLRKSESILIIISQTRANFGFGFEKKSRSGGNALLFYATWEIWSSIRNKISKTIQGKKRQLGVLCRIKIKKNRITGRERTVDIPIYHSFGIDDIGSCVDFLIEEGHWKKKKTKKAKGYYAKEFGFIGSKESIVKRIESESMETDLRDLVGEVWNNIEDACAIKRKKRYE